MIMDFNDLPSNLYTFGFDDNAKDRSPLTNDRVEWVLQWVNTHLSQRKTFNHKISSYGLKHIIERHLDTYVSNGEMIAAMYLAGFMVKRDGRNSPNAVFNLDTKSIKDLQVKRTGVVGHSHI